MHYAGISRIIPVSSRHHHGVCRCCRYNKTIYGHCLIKLTFYCMHLVVTIFSVFAVIYNNNSKTSFITFIGDKLSLTTHQRLFKIPSRVESKICKCTLWNLPNFIIRLCKKCQPLNNLMHLYFAVLQNV